MNTNRLLTASKPAKDLLTEAFPLGNGYMGALLSGGVRKERISLNEKTLWSGGPGPGRTWDGGIRPGGRDSLEKVRRLIREGREKEALKLADRRLTGRDSHYGSFEVLGTLMMTHHIPRSALREYRRSLDIENALHRVSFRSGGTLWTREAFCSYPANALVYRISSDRKGAVSGTFRLQSPRRGRETGQVWDEKSQTLELTGLVEENGLVYRAGIAVSAPGGTIRSGLRRGNPEISVSGADEWILTVTAGTDYAPLYPGYRMENRSRECLDRLPAAAGRSWNDLREEHSADHRRLFSACDLILAGPVPGDDTFKRVKQYRKGEDPRLAELVFQYGRYLLIASSRPGTLPANLQGVWNPVTNPPWGADYHTNINVQMNYWPAEPTGLEECHRPLMDYIEAQVEPGRRSTEAYYGCRGWTMQTANNPFGYTAPGWRATWGHFPGAAAWLCRHMWEHYAYSQDRDFLENRAWPVLKEAALFWMDWLTNAPEGTPGEGYLISTPSYSPEHGPFSAGASMDHQIARDLLTITLAAGRLLKKDPDLLSELETVLHRIHPTVIGRHGQIQEWLKDIDSPGDRHRHVSHLYALYPAGEIDPSDTPELAAAAGVTLDHRGDDGTGWAIAWKGCFHARLGDGNRMMKVFANLLRPTRQKGMRMNYGGGLYPNLFCAHPPFQIDGNFGFTAAVAESLIQSRGTEIRLLPALPDAWGEGRAEGLRAQGSLRCSLSWKNGKLVEADLISSVSGTFRVIWENRRETAVLEKGINFSLPI